METLAGRTVLVTGAAGGLGRVAVAAAAAAGARVVLVGRDRARLDAVGAAPAVANPATLRAVGLDPKRIATVVAQAGPRFSDSVYDRLGYTSSATSIPRSFGRRS